MRKFPDDLSDAELANVSVEMYAVLNTNPAVYAATAAQVTDFLSKKNTYAADLSAHVAAQAEARSKTLTKNGSRDSLEEIIKFIVKQARLNGVSDADLAALGVPVGETGTSTPAATRPIGIIDNSQRLQQLMGFSDEAAPGSRRKPKGVFGCEIYRKIGGTPPVDYTECSFLTLDTESPYLVPFDGADAGKTAYYMLRWRFKDESTSAWSETVSATITG
jgi:hypothetical protein